MKVVISNKVASNTSVYKMYVWKCIQEDGLWRATETSEARQGAKIFNLANPLDKKMVMDILKDEVNSLGQDNLGFEVEITK